MVVADIEATARERFGRVECWNAGKYLARVAMLKGRQQDQGKCPRGNATG